MDNDIFLKESDISEDTIEQIEEAIGTGHSAWDTVPPERIITETMNYFLRRGQELEQEGTA